MREATVLIVAEGAGDREALISALTEAHFRAVGVNEQTVLSKLDHDGADLVLVSCKSSPGDGMLLERIKERDPEIGIVVLSRNGEQAVVPELLRRGADQYVVSPENNDDIVAAVDKGLVATHLRRAIAQALSLVFAGRYASHVDDLAELAESGLGLPALIERAGGVDLDAVVRGIVLHVWRLAKGNQTHAAKMLNITRDRMRYKIKKLALK